MLRRRILEPELHDFDFAHFGEPVDVARSVKWGSTPSIVFVGCSDAIRSPGEIVRSREGELHVLQNLGCAIPPWEPGQSQSAAAGLELALSHPRVSHLVVCGHLQCRLMKHLLQQRESVAHFSWLNPVRPLRSMLDQEYDHLDKSGQWLAACEENVLLQLEHVQTYPFIQHRLRQRTLLLHGWLLDESARSYAWYHAELGQFVQ